MTLGEKDAAQHFSRLRSDDLTGHFQLALDNDESPAAYRMRNVIERAFCKLKDWHAFATRYLAVAITFGSNDSRT